MNFAEYLSQPCEHGKLVGENCPNVATYRVIGLGRIMCSEHAYETQRKLNVDIRAMND